MKARLPHALALLTLALLSSGCPTENPTPPSTSVCPLAEAPTVEGGLLVPAVDDLAFAPREGWPTDAPMRRLGTAPAGDMTLGHPGTELVSGMALHGDELLLGADLLMTKHDRPNDTLEHELLLLRGRVEDGTQTLARVMAPTPSRPTQTAWWSTARASS
jgi:hypothetical protein